jgi:hypothetical protein
MSKIRLFGLTQIYINYCELKNNDLMFSKIKL